MWVLRRPAAVVAGWIPVPPDRGWAAPVALVLIGAAVLLWPDARWPSRPGERVRTRAPRRRRSRLPSRVRRGLLAAAATVASGVLVGAPGWLLAAAATAAFAAGRWLPERSGGGQSRRPGRGGETSVAGLLDLLATAMEAGLPLPQAISAVAGLEESTAAGMLREVGQLLALGVAATDAWRSVADDRDLAPLAVAAVRSAVGGVTMADAAREAAREVRDRCRIASERAAARAELAMIAPLALCFLPAFLCLGLAPVVIGLVAGLHLF